MARSSHHNRSPKLWKQRGLEFWYEDQIFKKRLIKRSVKQKRRLAALTEPPPVASETIPIKILEELHPGIFHPVIGGKYERLRGRIGLYGFVVEPSAPEVEAHLLVQVL